MHLQTSTISNTFVTVLIFVKVDINTTVHCYIVSSSRFVKYYY